MSISDERVEQIIEMLEEGKSITYIKESTLVSKETVIKIKRLYTEMGE
jgi:hypothetical protein